MDELPFDLALPAMVLSKEAAVILEGGEPLSGIVAGILLGLAVANEDPDTARDIVDTIVPLPQNAPPKMRTDLRESTIVGARTDLLESAKMLVGRWRKAKQLAAILGAPDGR